MAVTTPRRPTGAPARATGVKKAASPAKKAASPAKKAPGSAKASAAKKAASSAKKAASPVKKAAVKTSSAKRVPATKAVAKKSPTARVAKVGSQPVTRKPKVVAVEVVQEAAHQPVALVGAPTTAQRARRRVLVGAGVALVLLLIGGTAAFALRNPAPSKESYIAKADVICQPGNGPVTAIVRPTNYPELSTASAAIVTATNAEVDQLSDLRRPGGQDGKQAEAAIKALTAYSGAAAALRDAAVKKDDAATIAGTSSLKTAFAGAEAEAKTFGFTSCGTGMKPGVDATLAGAVGVIKTGFTAKADSLCRAASTKTNALPATPDTEAGLIADLNGGLAIIQKLVADLRTIPVAPGDESAVTQMLDSADKLNTKGAELRDAIAATDYARADAIIKELGPMSTDANHRFDAYGLQVCGSNFGS